MSHARPDIEWRIATVVFATRVACIAPLIAAEKYPSKAIARVGKLRVLAVTTAKRSALLPGVPPIAETLKGFDMTSWNGLFAPAGTPQAIVARLTQEALATLAQADVKDRLAALGFEVDPLDPAAFGHYVRERLDT